MSTDKKLGLEEKRSFQELYRDEKKRGVKYPGLSKEDKEYLDILEECSARSGRNMHIRCTK